MRNYLLVLAVVAGLACGKKKDDDKGSAPGPAPGDPAGKTTAGTTPAKPPEPPPPPAPKVLTPADVSADKPLSVAEVQGIANQWPEDKEVTVAGYYAPYIGDDVDLATSSSIDLAAQPGQQKDASVVQCKLVKGLTGKVTSKDPLVFKGKLAGIWPPQIWVKDCTLVSSDKPFDAAAPAVPGSATPIPADKLHAAVTGWIGKEISVTGAFFGVTTSKGKGDKIIDVRADLLSEIGSYDNKVGCHLPLVEPDAALTALMEKNKSALTVRGPIKEIVFGHVQIDPCTVTSK